MGLALKQRGLATRCFFCIIQVNYNSHRFIQCLIACSDLELYFLTLVSFGMVLFYAKAMSVCPIPLSWPKIKDGDCFPISKVLGIAS